MIKASYECHHCGKTFMMERAFMNHRCHQMERAELLHTATGQAAYSHYSTWMSKNGRKIPPADTFKTSMHFTSFVKFAEFVKSVNVPNPDKYIEIMASKSISPALWCRNECYAMYLEWNDRLSSPYEQAALSVETIMKIAEAGGCKPAEVFKIIQPGEIIQLLIERQLSPWVLLCSRSFKEKLQSMSEDEHRQLMRLIGIDFWALKLERNPEVVTDMKNIAVELGI